MDLYFSDLDNRDEYDLEVRRISRRLHEVANVAELTDVIVDVFEQSFRSVSIGSTDRYRRIAERIMEKRG